jgi:hypothetical protein
MTLYIQDVYNRLLPLVGVSYVVPIVANKGKPGHYLETLLGIPHTSNPLDCEDGEVKIVPLKKLKKGTIVPKETIAITMLSKEDLSANTFEESKCCAKMNRMMVVPYMREGDAIRYLTPCIIDREAAEFAEFYKTAAVDYAAIRSRFIESGILESKTGTLLQNRTKGAGHGTTSRAFYLRPEFVKRYVPIVLSA